MKKQFFVLTMFVLILVGFNLSPFTALAQEGGANTNEVSISELEDDPNVTIKRISYEEMIEKIADLNGITVEEARLLHPNKALQERKLAKYSAEIGTLASPDPDYCGYSPHEINIRQDVTTQYQPTLQLFVWTCGSGSFWEFDSIEDAGLNRRDSDGTVKQFSGKVRAEITSPTTIWWHINGDFYDKGTTNFSGSTTFNGLVWQGSASISYASNYYAYHNDSGVYSIY